MVVFSRDQVQQINGEGGRTFVCTAGILTIRLMSHFSLYPGEENERTDRWGNHPVREAVVTLDGTTVTASSSGVATFVFEDGSMPEGRVTLSMEARADEARPWNAGPAGPGLLAGVEYDAQPSRMYRPVEARITITDGYFDEDGINVIRRGGSYAAIYRISACVLEIDWRPDFIQSPVQAVRARPIDLVILHHTQGLLIGSTISGFGGDTPDSNMAAGTSSHYVVDTDGFVLKMVPDESKAFHAGEGNQSLWQGWSSVGENAIGIEIVHEGEGAFLEVQYRVLIRLLNALVTAHASSGLTHKRIVYHSDVRMNDDGRFVPAEKKGCPSKGLLWSRFVQAGFGPKPYATSAHYYAVQSVYHGFFNTPGAALLPGDDDATATYGGSTMNHLAGAGLIATLQRRLARIGYSIHTSYTAGLTGPNIVNGQAVDGKYNAAVASSVDSFRIHFMSRRNMLHENTPFDFATALALEAAYQDL